MGKKARLKKLKKQSEDGDAVSASTTLPRPDKKLGLFIIAILFLAIFSIGVVLRVTNLEVAMRSPDERVYTEQGKTIVQKGAQGIKLLVHQDAINSAMWIYPLPTRVGYLWPLAAYMKLINSTDIKAGSYISCFSSIISLLLLIVIGVRFFNKWIALFGLLFLSVSPMDLAIARRTWQDAMFGCVGLFLIWFSCEISRSGRQIIWYAFFIITGSYCILIKETGVIIYGLCIIWILWILLAREKAVLRASLLVSFAAIGVILSVSLLAYASGGVLHVIEVLKHHKEAMPTNQYAVDYQTGPWYNLLLGVWIMSPANTILFVIGIIGLLFDGRLTNREPILPDAKKKGAISWIIFIIIAFMTVAIITPCFQNLRYISVLYIPFYLVSGLGLWFIISLARYIFKGFSFSAAIALIIIASGVTALSDYKKFEKIFVRTGIADLSIRLLKESSR